MDYFKQLEQLLKTERQEDRATYQQIIERSSVNQRVNNGLSWYPIAIRDTEMTRGDYLSVEIDRTTNHEIPHQLRFGSSAALFSNHDPKINRVEGVISHVSGNKLKLTLRTDELPDWSRDGKLGIDLLFDENSYEEMQNALKLASLQYEKNHLIQVLTGQRNAVFNKHPHYHSEKLNTSQNEAVNKILSAEDVAVVHGPPGTGKTTTLVQAIKAIIKEDNQKILVVAPSNTAVDLLSEKLSEEGLNVIRIGNPVRVSEKLISLTLDSRMAAHSSMKEIRKLKKQANEYRSLAHKYKRNFGKAEREQRKALFDEAHKIIKDVEKTEQYIIDDVISKAQIITATLVGANHYTVRNLKYHTVIIDEAAQAIEPACWIPVLKAKKLVMAGDHFQLPPTIKSEQAALDGLEITLLEKTVALHPQSVVLLEEQYRMHEMIMHYSSVVFYENRLKANISVAHRVLFENDSPLSFIDTAGTGFEEKQEGTSISNNEEAHFVLKYLVNYFDTLKLHYTVENFPSIAVISPYKQQVILLQDILNEEESLMPYAGKISVNTIDSFQGQERDIVCISMTRSNTENRIGFLTDVRRMNVAFTRARKKLIIIGDSSTLSQDPFYDNFIKYAMSQNAWQSAWEFMG
ncbi:MAG: AAA family ATPase [Chitinophagaceae bacterium]|nr:AAA family ATPase [Chitinophagaceae bacterium]